MEDGTAHQLARAVIGDVAPALHVVDGKGEARDRPGPGRGPPRIDRGMFDEDQGIGTAPLDALADQAFLQFPDIEEILEPEFDDFQPAVFR